MQYGYIGWFPGKRNKRIDEIVAEMSCYYTITYRYEYEIGDPQYICGKAAYEKAVELFNNEKYWWMRRINIK